MFFDEHETQQHSMQLVAKYEVLTNLQFFQNCVVWMEECVNDCVKNELPWLNDHIQILDFTSRP